MTIVLVFVSTEDEEAISSRSLCATNGITYPSLCHLIQDTGNEGVAYAGACNSSQCNSGNVRRVIAITLLSNFGKNKLSLMCCFLPKLGRGSSPTS